MRRLILQRGISTDQGTPGMLMRERDLSRVAFTIELPWRDNIRRKSCIPTGRYRVEMVRSPLFGSVYLVQNVPGRDAILIHSGNFGGNTDLGFASDILGCILLGQMRGVSDGRYGTIPGTKGMQLAVLVTRPAVSAFQKEMEGKPFELEIRS